MGLLKQDKIAQSGRIGRLGTKIITSETNGTENKISKMVSITQVDYDAIGVDNYEEDTLYIISG